MLHIDYYKEICQWLIKSDRADEIQLLDDYFTIPVNEVLTKYNLTEEELEYWLHEILEFTCFLADSFIKH